MQHIDLKRTHGDFGFKATDAAGHVVKIDSSLDSGGDNYGARPMQMLLMALGGCSGIDIVSILKKQRQEVEDFSMHIEGSRQKDTDPSLWENIHIVFELKGKIDLEKARRACELSIGKYCSVAATLKAAGAQIKWDVRVVE